MTHDMAKLGNVGYSHLTIIPTASLSTPMATAVIRSSDFQLISEFMRPDAKKRVLLGEAICGTAYNVYRNSVGQIVLDPVKAIPAAETWLWENPAALAAVKQGLRESAEGKRVYRGSFAKHAKE